MLESKTDNNHVFCYFNVILKGLMLLHLCEITKTKEHGTN